MKRQRNVSLLPQILQADVLHPRVLRAAVEPHRQRLANQLFLGIAEAVLREAHVLRQLAEQPHIRARLARRLDGLLRQLHEVVSVGALDIGVFQEGRCRKHVIRVIRRVVEEEIVHHRKQIRPRHSLPHGVLIRSHRPWIRVVHEQRMHSWTIFRRSAVASLAKFSQCLAELRHIHGPRRTPKWRVQRQVHPLQLPLVPRECT